jgi:hypothetical protein
MNVGQSNEMFQEAPIPSTHSLLTTALLHTQTGKVTCIFAVFCGLNLRGRMYQKDGKYNKMRSNVVFIFHKILKGLLGALDPARVARQPPPGRMPVIPPFPYPLSLGFRDEQIRKINSNYKPIPVAARSKT